MPNDPELGDGLRGRHALLVEDDYFIAHEMHDWLAEVGIEVVGPFATIAEPTALLNAQRFELDIDIAVLDVNLGHQAVYPLARRLMTRGVPVLFVTAYAPEHINSEFRTVARLTKPLFSRQLQIAVAKLVLGEEVTPPPRRSARSGPPAH